jgi:hypothetical protein
MPESQKNTRVKAPQKPMVSLPPKPVLPKFNKPFFNNKQKSFTTAFHTQNKGGGGK